MESIGTAGPGVPTKGPVTERPATEPAVSTGMSVPSDRQTTSTAIEVPEEEAGVNAHPVAVPEFVKSEVVRPVIDSEKSRVKSTVRDVDLVTLGSQDA
jgi:hypothetical protein